MNIEVSSLIFDLRGVAFFDSDECHVLLGQVHKSLDHTDSEFLILLVASHLTDQPHYQFWLVAH